MTAAPAATSLTTLLIDALQMAERHGMGDYTAAKAAAAFLLAYVRQGERAFHPHDPGFPTAGPDAEPELVALVEAYPDLDNAWRRQMAAEQLADVICHAERLNSAAATEALQTLADIAQHHLNPLCGPADGDDLSGLAAIADGRA